eukprot:TRINITY_DN5592_c0_g1_i1.p1 TRINITY_DN5592_c0_g1~~TRINITY_DN5592_c0_g1_i1.p1  ORF type:complete len:377 (-),score=104.59 TRINITY_DN5592_c0_g1_i1:74-1204(-)
MLRAGLGRVATISQAVTLLDMVAYQRRSGHGCARATRAQRGLLAKALPGVNALLREQHRCALEAVGDDGGVEAVGCDGDGHERLDDEALAHVLRQLEAVLEAPETFDYGSLVREITRWLLEALIANCPYLDRSQMRMIHAVPAVPFNEKWSVQMDISFEGGAEGGNVIAFPDANKFSEGLIKAWEALAHKPGRTHRDFFFRCYRGPPHEVIHCVQTKIKQFDSTGWIAEHDASFVSGSLMYALSQHPSCKLLFPEGLYEDVLVNWEWEVEREMQLFGGDIEQEYQTWRTACGLFVPKMTMATPGASYYLKNRLGLEALSEERDVLRQQLEMCLVNRTGDVSRLPAPTLPPATAAAYATCTGQVPNKGCACTMSKQL